MFADELSSMADINVLNVVVNKQTKSQDYDVFEKAWQVLIQRFENTISHRNFPGPSNPDERGIIIPDNTDAKKLTRLIRRMRRFNPVPSQLGYGYRNLLLRNTIEDPFMRDSNESYFIQAADLCAFLLYQNYFPKNYVKKTGAHNYFYRLGPILCKVASRENEYGIVNI